MSIESVTPSNHLVLCRPLLLPPSISPRIGVFSSESVLHIRWPKYWSSVLPVNVQGWSPLGCTGWISLQSRGLSRVFSSTAAQSINSSFTGQPSTWPPLPADRAKRIRGWKLGLASEGTPSLFVRVLEVTRSLDQPTCSQRSGWRGGCGQ